LLSLLLLSACASTPQKAVEGARTDLTALLESNRITTGNVTLSLPPGWTVRKPASTEKTDTVLLFRKSGRPTKVLSTDTGNQQTEAVSDTTYRMYGKYDKLAIKEKGIPRDKAFFLYTEVVHQEWKGVSTYEMKQRKPPVRIITAQKTQGKSELARIAYLIFDHSTMHVLEFTAPAEGLPMQTLTSYVLSGFDPASDSGPCRVQEAGISFYETTGAFRFHSDIRGGILLLGKLLGYSATVALIPPESDEHLRVYRHLQKSDSPYSETLYINEQRTEVNAESLMEEDDVLLIRASIPLPAADTTTPYLMELRLDTQENELNLEQIFSSPELRHLLQRELFFPRKSLESRKESAS